MTQDLGSTAGPVLLDLVDGRRLGVGRVFCVGRNYADHAREMGADPTREAPFFFTKWASTVVPGGGAIAYPPATDDYHHEVEWVVALGADARVIAHAVGLDMTRRDLQAAAKAAGRPWDTAKNVEQGAPVGVMLAAGHGAPAPHAAITLEVDGVRRQSARLSDMIWSVDEIIQHLGQFYRLGAGDLIFTGTPAGVGPVMRGQRLRAAIDGLPPLEVQIL